jgi:hypothetical protein
MSVFIGDLMAAADERYLPGGGKKKTKRKRGGAKKKAEACSCCESCGAPIPREDEGKASRKRPGKLDVQSEVQRESMRPLSLRKQKWMPPKRMGELSELDFLRKTMGMGMIVSKPWGDSYRYDFICDTWRLWRVQVRSTDERFGARGYAVHASVYVGKKIVGLTEKDIDVIVAYIVSRDIWYVVPVKAFAPRKNLWFYPDGSKKGARFEKYREAWWVLMGRKKRESRKADGRGRKRD